MQRGHLAALLALAAAACLLAPTAGRSLAGEPLLTATKPWESKKAEYQKPLIGILAQVCWQGGTRNQLRAGLRGLEGASWRSLPPRSLHRPSQQA